MIRRLSKILGVVPKAEREGITMGDAVGYKVDGIKGRSLPDFLRALPALLPEGSILYLEDTSKSADDLVAFLHSHAAIETSKVALGTIWPRPSVFHVPIEATTMQELAVLSERRAAPEVCIHLHAYKAGRVLLEWYDAFWDELWVSRDIPLDKVAEFCRRLEARYETIETSGVVSGGQARCSMSSNRWHKDL